MNTEQKLTCTIQFQLPRDS